MTPSGWPIHQQVYDVFPSLRPLYFGFETEFDGQGASYWTGETYLATLAVVLPAYIVFLVVGKAVMASRPGFSLKTPLFVWNAFLALFSLAGALRLVPHLGVTLYSRGLYFAVCSRPVDSYGLGASGLWTALFIYSKIPELIDTVFVVLRKKKLLFLHYYHHITVLAYCLHSYATRASPGLWFCALNLVVHSIMYSYYAFSSLGYRPPWAMAVTLCQIAQMVVGMSLAAAVGYYWSQDLPCHQDFNNLVAGLAMYASYFVLFMLFFIHRYVTSGSKDKRA